MNLRIHRLQYNNIFPSKYESRILHSPNLIKVEFRATDLSVVRKDTGQRNLTIFSRNK
jgi:hypothetical protein